MRQHEKDSLKIAEAINNLCRKLPVEQKQKAVDAIAEKVTYYLLSNAKRKKCKPASQKQSEMNSIIPKSVVSPTQSISKRVFHLHKETIANEPKPVLQKPHPPSSNTVLSDSEQSNNGIIIHHKESQENQPPPFSFTIEKTSQGELERVRKKLFGEQFDEDGEMIDESKLLEIKRLKQRNVKDVIIQTTPTEYYDLNLIEKIEKHQQTQCDSPPKKSTKKKKRRHHCCCHCTHKKSSKKNDINEALSAIISNMKRTIYTYEFNQRFLK